MPLKNSTIQNLVKIQALSTQQAVKHMLNTGHGEIRTPAMREIDEHRFQEGDVYGSVQIEEARDGTELYYEIDVSLSKDVMLRYPTSSHISYDLRCLPHPASPAFHDVSLWLPPTDEGEIVYGEHNLGPEDPDTKGPYTFLRTMQAVCPIDSPLLMRALKYGVGVVRTDWFFRST